MAATEYPAGVYAIDENVYHSDPCSEPSLSASIAKLLCSRSPIHAWAQHPRLNPDFAPEESETFDIGKAAHRLLLEGDDAVVIVDADSWRTNAAKDERDKARADGKVPLLARHWQAVQSMVTAARIQLEAVNAQPPVFTDGEPERTLIWQEPNGVTCRARLDWLRTDRLAVDDYKTAANANPEKWTRGPLFDNGYDIQAEFYLRGVKATTGADAEFRFVVQEKQPPYALCVVQLTPAVLALAEAKVEYAIGRWRDCLDANVWPGYPTEICHAELPGWEEARWLEKEGKEF